MVTNIKKLFILCHFKQKLLNVMCQLLTIMHVGSKFPTYGNLETLTFHSKVLKFPLLFKIQSGNFRVNN